MATTNDKTRRREEVVKKNSFWKREKGCSNDVEKTNSTLADIAKNYLGRIESCLAMSKKIHVVLKRNTLGVEPFES